jgi:hypothetical protein
MTGQTSLRIRYSGEGRALHTDMSKSAIESETFDMVFVTEGNRLLKLLVSSCDVISAHEPHRKCESTRYRDDG